MKSMATLSIYIRRTYIHAFWSRGGPAQRATTGRPVNEQMSLKSPRKWLICYLTLNGKIAATAMDKELNTRQDVLLVQLGCTKLQLTSSF